MKIVYEGELIPFGYGYVRYDYPRDARLFAPMPLNWIIRWSTALWIWLLQKSYKPLTQVEVENHARVQAEIQRREGMIDRAAWRRGRNEGFIAGWEACSEFMVERLKKL